MLGKQFQKQKQNSKRQKKKSKNKNLAWELKKKTKAIRRQTIKGKKEK